MDDFLYRTDVLSLRFKGNEANHCDSSIFLHSVFIKSKLHTVFVVYNCSILTEKIFLLPHKTNFDINYNPK